MTTTRVRLKPEAKLARNAAPIPYTAQETALIARALHDAAKLHRYGYDPECNEDPLLGQRMLDLLGKHFSDAMDAYQRADVLREAVNLGFLPPPSGDVMLAAEAYLTEVLAAKEAAKAQTSRPPLKRRRTVLEDDLDTLPF